MLWFIYLTSNGSDMEMHNKYCKILSNKNSATGTFFKQEVNTKQYSLWKLRNSLKIKGVYTKNFWFVNIETEHCTRYTRYTHNYIKSVPLYERHAFKNIYYVVGKSKIEFRKSIQSEYYFRK